MPDQALHFTSFVFGPALSSGGERVGARIESGHLYFNLRDGRVFEVPLSRIRLSPAGFNDQDWEMSWDEDGDGWALMLDHSGVQAQLLTDTPVGLKLQLVELRKAQKRAHRAKRPRLSGLTLAIVAPVALIVIILLHANSLAAGTIRFAGLTQEQRLGEIWFKALRRQLVLLEGTAVDTAVASIGERLTAGSGYTWHWHVARDPAVALYAVPGGHITVTTGLVRAAESPEELAYVLAHAIQHVEQRHSLASLGEQAGLAMMLSMVAGDAGGVAQVAGELSDLIYTREQERSADLAVIAALQKAGIAAEGAPTMFGKLQAGGVARRTGTWPSRHPASEQRIYMLQSAIDAAGLYPVTPLDVDWLEVREALALYAEP